MHHRADTIDADLRILGLAVPQPPAQALDLLDDRRLRGRALRTLGRQASGNLRQVPPCCMDRGCGRTELGRVPGYAIRAYSGRPRSSIRFSTSAAMATSLA